MNALRSPLAICPTPIHLKFMARRYGTQSQDRWDPTPERGWWDWRWIVQYVGGLLYFLGR
jgi:hypothetical protein